MKQKHDINSDIDNQSGQGQDNSTEANLEGGDSPDQVEQNDLEKVNAELAAANDKYLRLYSDFENYKKRNARERLEFSKMAGADILSAMLPIIDDFERAIKSLDDTKDKAAKEGIKLIYSKIKSVTESKGLKEMSAAGKPFDAELHDAIANVPVTNDNEKGMVIEEVEKGYFLHDKVIRHAKVVVGN